MKIKVISPPTTEPVSLDLARRHCRIMPDSDSPPSHPDDAWLLEVGIPTAREYCEDYLGRAIAPATWEIALDAFPAGSIQLPTAADSVSEITYVDTDGNLQTLDPSNYILDNYSQPAVVAMSATLDAWPDTQTVVNAVKVRFQPSAYTQAGDSPNSNPLPYTVLAAMLLMIGHLYENREATTFGRDATVEIPLGVKNLLVPKQLRMSMA